MIESKFHLTHKQWEVPFEASVIHLQSSFGKSPEVLDPVNVCTARAEAVTMANSHMAKALQVHLIMGPVTVRVDPRVRTHMRLDGTLQARLVHPLRKDHAHSPIAFKQPKYRGFAASPSSPLALAHAAEIGLVNLDLAGQQSQGLRAGQCNVLTYPPVVSLERLAVESQVIGYPCRRDHQPEQASDLPQGGIIEPVLRPLGRIFQMAAFAFSTAIRELVSASRTTLRTLDMLSMTCHQIGVGLVTRLKSIKTCIFRHQTMLAWSDLMV